MALVLIFQERVTVSADCDITKGQFEDKELKDGISSPVRLKSLGSQKSGSILKVNLHCFVDAMLFYEQMLMQTKMPLPNGGSASHTILAFKIKWLEGRFGKSGW